MGIDLDDIQEVCSYESIGITVNGYVKIYELKSVNYAGVEPYECVVLDDDFITFLLKRYKKMYLYDRSKEWFHKMPEYITHLILDFRDYNDINLDKLHNGLQSLVIISTNCFDYYKHFNKPLENLPQSLKTLEIVSPLFNQPLDLLPISITKLSIRSNNFIQSLSNLPISLYCLTIDICDEYGHCNYLTDNLMNLPEGLEELKIAKKKMQIGHIVQNEKKYLNCEKTFLDTMKTRYPNLDIFITY